MPAKKKVTVQVIADAVQHDGSTYANGQQFEVAGAAAKELLAAVRYVATTSGGRSSRRTWLRCGRRAPTLARAQ